MRRGCEGYAKGRSIWVTGEKGFDEAAVARLFHSSLRLENNANHKCT